MLPAVSSVAAETLQRLLFQEVLGAVWNRQLLIRSPAALLYVSM